MSPVNDRANHSDRKGPADAALSDNIDLSTKHELEDGMEIFWEHLTVSGFDLYRNIWERLPKTDGRYVKCKCRVYKVPAG
jgi:hypothetical protein